VPDPDGCSYRGVPGRPSARCDRRVEGAFLLRPEMGRPHPILCRFCGPHRPEVETNMYFDLLPGGEPYEELSAEMSYVWEVMES
jgi:hypothetical protein